MMQALFIRSEDHVTQVHVSPGLLQRRLLHHNDVISQLIQSRSPSLSHDVKTDDVTLINAKLHTEVISCGLIFI